MKKFNSRNVIDRLLPVLVFVLAAGFVIIYTSQSNIHGDGKFHTLIAREIAETDTRLDHLPNGLLRMDGGEKIYYPINYPQTYHVILSALYDMGGEPAIEFSSALFAGLSALFLFLMLRHVNAFAAAGAGLFAVILNARRFVMVPLMEQGLLAVSIATIYLTARMIQERSWRFAIAAGIFAGLSASIKQQGWIIPLLLGVVVLGWAIREILRTKHFHALGFFALFAVAAALIAIGPFMEHVARNGTIGYVPGSGTSGILGDIPIVKDLIDNRFPQDSIAAQRVTERIGYLTRAYVPLWQTALSFVGFPIVYTTITDFSTETLLPLLLLSILTLIGSWFLFRKDRTIFWILFAVVMGEFLFTWKTQSRIEQYHALGVAATAPFLMLGIAALWTSTKRRAAVILWTAVMIVGFSGMYLSLIHQSLYGHSGRQFNKDLAAFQELAAAVDPIVPTDAVVLSASTNFQYYVRRDSLWLSTGGAPEVTTILESEDPEEAKKWLGEYKIDYIFIEWKQLQRIGLRDFIPPRGLVNYIDHSEYFEEVYSVIQDNQRVLTLYRIKLPIDATESL